MSMGTQDFRRIYQVLSPRNQKNPAQAATSEHRTSLMLALLLVLPWVGQGQPAISGRVLNAQTGYGIIGIDLDVFDAQGHAVVISGDTTGTDGRYMVSLPSAGSYSIRADPGLADFFVDQYYSNVFLRSEATLIAVGPSETVSNINFSLRSGYQIRGDIRSQGVGLADVDLDLYAANGEFLSGYPGHSASDGSFALGVLPPGTYYIRAKPDLALGQYFVPAYYGGAVTRAHATPIMITNADVTGVVLDLVPGGGISGHVVDRSTASPLVNFDLDLYDTNHVYQPFAAFTDTNGSYVLGPVPPGRYQLRVDPTVEQGYARTYYSNFFFHASAQTIEVQAGRMTPSIDFALSRAGSVAGRIVDADSGQPLAGIDVHAYYQATNLFDVFAKTDTNGDYLLGPLPVGSHFMRAYPDLVLGHLRQYYNGTTNLAGATPVGIGAGMTSSNINFRLPSAGWIEGIVSNTAGVGLAGIDLDLYEATTGEWLLAGAFTKSNGFYQVGPLPPGQYKLRCDPTISQGYAVEYFNGKLTKTLADPVIVTATRGTSNVNFTLDPGGSLAGQVVAADTGLPVSAGIDIDVLQAGTLVRLDQNASTDAYGRFAIGPLPSGTYLLRADPLTTSVYLRTYYGDTLDVTAAQPIVLGAPGAVTNVDIRLIGKLPPVITSQPQSQTVVVGSNVTFIVSASGTSPLSYQWWHDQTPVTNAIASMLVLSDVQLLEAGSYWVVVTNVAGSVTSNPAILTITEPSSAPRMLISLVTPSAFRISIESPSPGSTYQLETRQSLAGVFWTTTGLAVTNTTGKVNWDLSLDNSAGWYRVRTQPLP